MVTMGIRIMANLPDRKDDQPRVDHWGQSGHFYLAESGHFYLGITGTLRIMYIMSNHKGMAETVGAVGAQNFWQPAKNRESGSPRFFNMLYAPVGVGSRPVPIE